MKRIPLSKGYFALVDDTDYEWLNQWRWIYNGGYAARRDYQNSGGKMIYMHVLIADTPSGLKTDHINRNKLDNRRCNLRGCSSKQNMWNKGRRVDSKSGYKGVSWHKTSKMWQCYVGRQFIGVFKDPQHAALAYDLWAKDVFGEYAVTNFPSI
jgi:hypothetical protein